MACIQTGPYVCSCTAWYRSYLPWFDITIMRSALHCNMLIHRYMHQVLFPVRVTLSVHFLATASVIDGKQHLLLPVLGHIPASAILDHSIYVCVICTQASYIKFYPTSVKCSICSGLNCKRPRKRLRMKSRRPYWRHVQACIPWDAVRLMMKSQAHSSTALS